MTRTSHNDLGFVESGRVPAFPMVQDGQLRPVVLLAHPDDQISELPGIQQEAGRRTIVAFKVADGGDRRSEHRTGRKIGRHRLQQRPVEVVETADQGHRFGRLGLSQGRRHAVVGQVELSGEEVHPLPGRRRAGPGDGDIGDFDQDRHKTLSGEPQRSTAVAAGKVNRHPALGRFAGAVGDGQQAR